GVIAEAQEAGQILDEEKLAFLADLGIPASQAQTIIPHNAAFQTEDLNTYDSDCDDLLTALAVLMANISNYRSNVISEANVQDINLQAQQDSMILSVIEQMSEQIINHVNNWEKENKEQNNESITAELENYKERVKTFEQRLNIDLSSHKKMIDSQMNDMIREKLALKEQIDSLEQNLSKQIKEKEFLFKTFTVFKNESKEKENKYMENEIDLEKKIKELDNIGYKVDEEQLAFLADPGIPSSQAQTVIPHNAAFHTEDLNTYDSDYNDLSNAQAVLMANISNYGSDVILEVPNSETYLNDMDNQSVHALQNFKQSPVMDFIDNEISSDSNIIPYLQYLQETQQTTVQDINLLAQQDSMILSVIEQMSEQMINHVNNWEKANKEQKNESITAELERYKERVKIFKTFIVFKNESKEKEDKYMENEIYLEKKIKELDNIICKVGQSAQQCTYLEEESRSKMSEKAKDPEVIAKKISFKPIDYENLNSLSDDFEKHFSPQQELSAEQAFWFHILNPSIESSFTPPVPKVSLVNASLKKLKFHLTQFDSVVKKRTTPNALEEGEWGFEHTKTIFNNEIIPFLKSLKDIFNVFDKDLLNEITEVQTVFDQMDAVVQQSLVDKECLEIAKKEILLKNDRLL
ncbi:hypothetical protein Tco_0439652, partial [Tanacetum coccineum]